MSTDIRIALVGVSGLAALLAGVLVLTQPSLNAAEVAEPWQLVTPVIDLPTPPEEPKQELIEAAAETPPVRAPVTLTPDIADVVAEPTHKHPEPPTPDPSAKTPAFGDDFAAELPVCGGQFATGRWSMDSPGATGTFTSLTADTGGPCESVQIGFDAVAPSVEIMRIPHLNYTVIRFDTDQVALAPGPTALSPSGGLVTGVVAFQDSNGPAVLVQHPSGVEVAARSVTSSNSVTIEFRAAQDSDLAHDGAFDGEVGWDSPSGDPDLDVWYSTEVSVIGNP